MTTIPQTVVLSHPSRLYRFRRWIERLIPHLILIGFTVLALFPIVLIVMNSFKIKKAIFGDPFALPNSATFSLIGYETVFQRSSFQTYFVNSMVVTISALLLTLWIGSMASFALSEYPFKGNAFMAVYLSIGIMIPIRLGTVGILRMMVAQSCEYSAGFDPGLHCSSVTFDGFILTALCARCHATKEAARLDGASEYQIYGLVVPLVRPALGAIGIFTMIPIWNDLWFPLILAPSSKTATITLGVQQFLGQFDSDWNAVLSSLTLAMIPILLFYLIFSQQMIQHHWGAVK
jgi:raffinose/stachyose/melibiose transport system permease protein